ncbi:MAG: cation-translocating P-type ATPase [Oscillospiraceae bacterium]|jgi:Ca2+-transporting ATPase
MNYYDKEKQQVLDVFEVDPEIGATLSQVEQRLAEYGKNELAVQKKSSLVKRIIFQLKDVSIIVLLVATLLSFALAIHHGSGLIEPMVILVVVILNVVLAITQEGKAEKALSALAEMNAPTCIVLREGSKKNIDTSELVPGDIIVLETGDVVPADARLLETTGLFSDESALTGESEASEKDSQAIFPEGCGIGDQSNMVFSGCIITAGHGVAVVTAIGMNTEMGKIAEHLNEGKLVKTPLQHRLDSLGKTISWIALASAFFLLAVGLRGGTDLGTMMMVAISLAVAAVPETLSLIVTLSLTNGVQKMVTKNALIRKLQAVETLGNTSVICSDKTGTLTQNRMTVKKLYICGDEAFDADSDFNEAQKQLLILLAMCSNATVETDEQGVKQYIGDATESAIIRLFDQKGYSRVEMDEEYPKVFEIPFSSERKRMTVVVQAGDKGWIVVSKGAIERLPLAKISESVATKTQEVHNLFAENALRVIGVGYKYIEELPEEENLELLERDLTLLGLVGLIDPPRPEVAAAIQKAKAAGIRTVMITGDHAATAGAIAREIGILEEGQKVLTGTELAQMPEQELHDTVRSYSVYARVSPEDKIRIVKAWQANDEVVAMTGDGVNDAPALRAADVGVAMGKTGTEVAKSTSDMILTDDNFTTIVEAVDVGRNTYENIRKTIHFLLVCNFSEIVIMLFAQIAGWGIVLTPVLLLLINLLGDGIPGLQLAREVSDENLMNQKPIRRDDGFFKGELIYKILRQTVACSVVSLLAYYLGAFVAMSGTIPNSAAIGQTMAFLTVGWTSILHVFHVRTKKSVFKRNLHSNKPLVLSAVIMICTFALIVVTPVRTLFGLSYIGIGHWAAVVGLTIVPTFVREIDRMVYNHPQVVKYRNQRKADAKHAMEKPKD